MNRSETIKHPNCPQWLKDADWKGDVTIDDSGFVTFHKGTWKDGMWCDGTWCDGTWCDGNWEGGNWKGGNWEGGNWKGGNWESGTWMRGIWKSGAWKSGDWYSGTWCDGTWEGGTWYNGAWKDGTWMSGVWYGGAWRGGKWLNGFVFVETSCNCQLFLNNTTNEIKIGCKIKTAADWYKWFDSNEEYDTPRNSKEFKQIYKAFLYVIEVLLGGKQ